MNSSRRRICPVTGILLASLIIVPCIGSSSVAVAPEAVSLNESEGGMSPVSRSRDLYTPLLESSPCTDSPDKRFFLRFDNSKNKPITRWCEWINTSEREEQACSVTEGYRGFKTAMELCPEKCDTCPSVSPSTEPSSSPSSFCKDRTDRRFFLDFDESTKKLKTRLCAWLDTPRKVDQACAVTEGYNRFRPAREICLVSCDTCFLLHPSAEPSNEPSLTPSVEPSSDPTANPTPSPSPGPTQAPTTSPTASPSLFPSIALSQAPSTFYSQTFYIQSTFKFDDSVRSWCLQAQNIRENSNLNVRPCEDRPKQKWMFDNGMIRLSESPEFCIINTMGKILKVGYCENKSIAEFSFDVAKGGILALKRDVDKFYFGFNTVKKYEAVRLYTETAINDSLWLWRLEAI